MEHEDVWIADKNIVNIGTSNGQSINDLAGIVLQETKSHSLVKYHLYDDFFQNHKDVVYRVPDTTYGGQFYEGRMAFAAGHCKRHFAKFYCRSS